VGLSPQASLTFRKQVNKFLSVLSSLPDPASDSRQSSPLQSRSLPPMTSITASSSTRQFESFLKSIPKVKTLGEARRLRADIDREQRMAKTALEKHLHAESKDVESQAKKARKYVKRLERARLEVDARISALSRSPGKVRFWNCSGPILMAVIASANQTGTKQPIRDFSIVCRSLWRSIRPLIPCLLA